MELSRLGERGLAMQGFARNRAIRRVSPWLRVTPSLSTLWIVTGTALASPAVLLGFAALSAFGASRHRHPFDRLYAIAHRRAGRHGRARLPDNPPPRRFAMGLASAWALATAALFARGHRTAGRTAGGLLGLAGATVATTHFCFGSWAYRQLIEPTWRRRARSA